MPSLVHKAGNTVPGGSSGLSGAGPPPLPGDRDAPGPCRAGPSMAERPGPPLAGPRAPHASFFGPAARGNPVVDSFEAELRRVLGSLRRLRGAGNAEPPQHDLHRQG